MPLRRAKDSSAKKQNSFEAQHIHRALRKTVVFRNATKTERIDEREYRSRRTKRYVHLSSLHHSYNQSIKEKIEDQKCSVYGVTPAKQRSAVSNAESENIDEIPNVDTLKDHHINYEIVKFLASTTQYNQRLVREPLKIMKSRSNFNWDDRYKLSNTGRIILRDRRSNHNTETDTAQRTVMVTI